MKFLAAILILFLAYSGRADDQFIAGFSKANITPTEEQIRRGEVHLGGFGLGQKAEGVEDPIFARALTLAQSDGRNVLAIVILDVPGISNRVVDQISEEASFLTGIPRENIYVGATHTHFGPDLQGLWGGVSKKYLGQLISKTVHSILQAFQYRSRVHVRASRIFAENHNRRGWGFTDSEMTVLDFVRVSDDERMGTLINFAAHPVIGSGKVDDRKKISPDFCAALTNKFEQNAGGIAVYANGIVGDVSPIRFEGAANARSAYGEYLAERALASLKNQSTVGPSEIHVDGTQWENKVSNILFSLADLLGLLKYDMIHRWFQTYIRVNVGYFRLGETVQTVVFPGESLTRNGLAVKEQMKAEFRLWLGLTGNTLGYFVPSDEWKTGRHKNYEESISLDRQVGDRARDRLIEIIQKDQDGDHGAN